jgi:hypothetical protein
MKTIISSILIIACIISLHSCREVDEQQDFNLQQLTKIEAKTATLKEKDTAAASPIFETVPKDITDTDPPPKDGGQWKLRE